MTCGVLDRLHRDRHHGAFRYGTIADLAELENHASLAEAGLRHDELDRLPAHLGGPVSHRAVELVPSRRLAVVNAAFRAGSSPGTEPGPLVMATRLGQRPEPRPADWMTAHRTAHTVFPATDRGRTPAGLPPLAVDHLARWLPAWAAVCVAVWAESGHLGLLGELVLLDACLPVPGVPGRSRRLPSEARHAADGLVPYDSRPVAGDAAEQYANHHHPATVVLMAATLTLRVHRR